jgi:glycosyltransferase involved in cell wall biosynthesis
MMKIHTDATESRLPPVTVVIPAFNEEAGVARQVEEIRGVLQRRRVAHEIIVVDDGSTDRTMAEAVRVGARVLHHNRNLGYGMALKRGILVAKHDVIAITDADGTYPSEQIPALLEQLQTADMVVGARTGGQVHIPLVRRPAKFLLGWLANRVAGRSIPDLNSGLRVFRRECAVQYFPVLSNKFSFTSTITLAFLADDYEVLYHPIDYNRRVGQSKIAPRHFFDFTILVLRMAMLFQPLKVFLPMVAVFGALGFAKVLFDIVAAVVKHGGLSLGLLAEPILSISALILLLGSLQMLLIGLAADGLIRLFFRHNQPLVLSHGVTFTEVAPSCAASVESFESTP